MGIGLPVLSVERFGSNRSDRAFIKTAHVDTEPIWIGTGYVERFDATCFAEQMSGRAAAKRVGREVALTREESKTHSRNNEVQEPGL